MITHSPHCAILPTQEARIVRVSDKDATVTQGGGGGGAGGKVAPEVKHWKGSAEAAKWAGEAAQVWNGCRCGTGTGVEGVVQVWTGGFA